MIQKVDQEILYLKEVVKEKNKEIEKHKTQYQQLILQLRKIIAIVSKYTDSLPLQPTTQFGIEAERKFNFQREVGNYQPNDNKKFLINIPTNGSIGSGTLRMLKAAAMFYPNPITKTRMAALARLSYSSGSFATYIGNLKREGLITGDGKVFTITKSGLTKAGEVEPLPTDPDELINLCVK